MHKTFKNQSSTSELGEANEQNELNKTPTLKDLSHFKEFKTNIKIWDNQLPMRARFQQINQTLHTFYDGTKYQKRCVFQNQILDIDQDKNIKRECSNEYKRAPPRWVHYLGFCIWIQNTHK